MGDALSRQPDRVVPILCGRAGGGRVISAKPSHAVSGLTQVTRKPHEPARTPGAHPAARRGSAEPLVHCLGADGGSCCGPNQSAGVARSKPSQHHQQWRLNSRTRPATPRPLARIVEDVDLVARVHRGGKARNFKTLPKRPLARLSGITPGRKVSTPSRQAKRLATAAPERRETAIPPEFDALARSHRHHPFERRPGLARGKHTNAALISRA